MKIQTLFVILLIPITIMIALVLFTGKTMPSPTVFTFLVISGFCYMLCQIVFIGKLELFLENPLFSMALLISIFLFTNGFGSTLVDKLSGKINIRLFPFIVAGVVLVSFLLTVVGTKYLLTTFYLVKILYVIVVIAPVGLCLGFFYPYAIQWLNKTEQAYAVPVTYGISTLSSVMGATYAMTMIINLGYSNVLIQAIVGYFVLGVFLLIAARKA